MAWEFSAGEILTAANLNAVTKPWNAVCQVYRATVGVTDASSTAITFSGVDELDPLAWHDPGGGTPTRITPTIAGWYQPIAIARLVSATTTVARIATWIRKNGSDASMVLDTNPTTGSVAKAAGGAFNWIQLNGSTDYLEMMVFQDDTGSATNNIEARFTVTLEYPT